MTEKPANPPAHAAQDWDRYWRGAGEADAWTAGGARHPAIRTFWMDFFSSLREDIPAPRLLDVASGSGAVIECALTAFGGAELDAWCLDSSVAAIEAIRARFPAVTGLVSDARSIPSEAGQFDIVTSQFGVEYAGLEAIESLPGVLAAGGWMALLLHHGDGVIRAECAANLEAVRRVQGSRFVPLARDMFAAGFAAVKGADRAPYDDAAARLNPVLRVVEAVISEYGSDVAAGTVAQLYSDVARIHQRLPHYEAEEVLGWLERMVGELDAYAGRMASMLEAGLSGPQFDRVCQSLTAQGCILGNAGPLKASEREDPLGWALVARNPPSTR